MVKPPKPHYNVRYTERSEDFSQVAGAVRRIQTQYGEPLTVRELAKRAGLSAYQVEQRIRRIFHITAAQLIQKVRMDAPSRASSTRP